MIRKLLGPGLVVLVAAASLCAAQEQARKSAGTVPADLAWVEGNGIRCGVDRATGRLAGVETRFGQRSRVWLKQPVRLILRNEANNLSVPVQTSELKPAVGALSLAGHLEQLGLTFSQTWKSSSSGVTWDLQFNGAGQRAGHELTIELPILSSDSQIFTPSNRGVMDVAANPDFTNVPYGTDGWGWETGHVYYVLPLVSVFDAKADQALTIALPADVNIPHFQVLWTGSRILRLALGHRGMGGGKPTSLRLLFYTHAADYRSVLKAYSDDFPPYFKPALPRGRDEGAFYYHHIQDHPSFEEMARQRVRFLWSSFWFTHVGEYLPEATEWKPYSFANWWRLGEMMSDDKIRAFIRTMNEHGIGVFAFFNVDEYGGAGSYDGVDLHGDSPLIDKLRAEKYGDSLVKDVAGRDVPSWEGCKVVNPDHRYSYYRHLQEQVARHLHRLPEIAGFIIDRMDWASTFDYGHDDGLTMFGAIPAENMAAPIGEAVRMVCRLSHEQGKRVYLNHAYRIEVLKDLDGYCYENEYLPALGFLSSYRPASAWCYRKPYHRDLLQFEAQLKRRLQYALFPHMIAHDFPICQEEPDARAADLLEIYAPLFSTLLGKQQVLLPHCVAASGANDVNLFINGAGDYVVPVTSRTRFQSRGARETETISVTLRVPDGAGLAWAHVYSADGPPYREAVNRKSEEVTVKVSRHGTASMIVVGRGAEPTLDEEDAARLGGVRARLFPKSATPLPAAEQSPSPSDLKNLSLRIEGTQVGEWGTLTVRVDGKTAGQFSSAGGTFRLNTIIGAHPPRPLTVAIVAPDDGVWFAPQSVELFTRRGDGKTIHMAAWTPSISATVGATTRELRLPLRWCKPGSVERPASRGEKASIAREF
ncbi:MAG: hypothetical protein LAP13_03735 [Acidobacteriia bacterium]|nr:hypothetical protein [Terriglobia bacterium]